ncbi:hypothetical protein, partial [Pseudomonas viridiflava]|uniref:hypothetical protein n=1 Tax=Pseudomonas viridiflava TaxID=33069 RepID=UPI001CA82C59
CGIENEGRQGQSEYAKPATGMCIRWCSHQKYTTLEVGCDPGAYCHTNTRGTCKNQGMRPNEKTTRKRPAQ